MADGSLIFDTKISTKGFNEGINNLKGQANSLTGTFTKLGSTIALAFDVRQIINFSKQAVNLASDLQEVQNVVDTAFGDMAYKMEKFAETAIDTFGLSRLSAKQTGSTFMAMATGMGMVLDTASDMSISLTALSADMASFYNMSQSEASTALSSIFTGETETLKRYGILITEVNLEEYARQQGITKSIEKMTQLEKVQLRYNYVMNATMLAQGDFAKTSDSWANQVRVLSENWKELLTTLGNVLIPVLSKAIPYVTAFVRVMNDAIRALARLWGFDIPEIDYKSTTKGINSIGTGLKDVEKGAGKAKKALQNLSGVDELNIIGKKASEAGAGVGAIGGGGGGDLGLEMPTYDFGNIKKQSDEIYEKMKETFKKIADVINGLLPVIKTVGAALLTIWAVNKISDFIAWVGSAVKAIGGLKIVKSIGKAVGAFFESFHLAKMEGGVSTFKALKQGAKGFKSALSPLAKVLITVGGAVASFAITKNLFKEATLGTKSWGEALVIATIAVGGLSVAIGLLVSPVAGVVTALAGIAGAVVGVYQAQEEMMKQDINTYFSNGDISISKVADDFKDLADSLTGNEDKYLTNQANLQGTRDEATRVSDELTLLIGNLRNTGQTSVEETAKMKTAFQDLSTASEKLVTETGNNLKLFAYGMEDKLGAEAVNNFVSVIDGGADKQIGLIKEYQKEFDILNQKPIKTDADVARMNELKALVTLIGQGTNDISTQIEQSRSFFANKQRISFEDSTQTEQSLKDMSAAYDEVMKKQELAKAEQMNSLKGLGLEGNAEAIAFVEKSFEVSKQEIDAVLAPYFQTVIENYQQNYDAGKRVILDKINSDPIYGFWEITVGGMSWDEFAVKKMAEGGWKSVSQIITDASHGSGVPKIGMEHMLEFDTSKIQNKGKDVGKNVLLGEQQGIKENSSLAENAMIDSSGKVIGSAETKFDINSPSKVFFDIGKHLMQGLANGITGNTELATAALDELFNKMTDKLDMFNIKFRNNLDKLFRDTTDSANSLKMGADGKASYTPVKRNIPIPRLATGTVVPAHYGEFLAVLGDNKRETEIVSPLSTIKQALTEAIIDTGGLQNGNNGDIVIPIYLDGGLIDEVIVKGQQRRMTRSNGRGF